MARSDLEAAIRKATESIRKGSRPRACLVCGDDDYLRGRAATLLGEALIPPAERTPFNFRVLDGEAEDVGQILASLRTYSLFGGPTVVWIDRTRLLISRLNEAEVLRGAAAAWAEAGRRDDETGRARAARDVLKVLTNRHLDLGALDPASAGDDDALTELVVEAEVERAFLDELHAYCRERELAPGRPGGDAELVEALEEGWAGENTLVLVAAACDRRLKLFKALKKHGLVLDAGAAPREGREAEEVSRRGLAEMAQAEGVRFAPGAAELLQRKVGPDLTRLHSEVRKLATYVPGGQRIGEADVEAVVGWTREEGQWELSNAIQERDLPRALRALRRTLDHGAAPVRLFFQIAAKVRDILHARAALDGPLAGVWRPRTDDAAYRTRVRPRIEQLLAPDSGIEESLRAFLRSHPWAVLKSLQAAERYGREELLDAVQRLYDANTGLVRGAPPEALLEQLVLRVVGRSRGAGALQ